MTDAPTPSETFLAGADARTAGKALADNPHPPSSTQYREWAAGWSATFDLDEENDPLSTRMRKQDDIASSD